MTESERAARRPSERRGLPGGAPLGVPADVSFLAAEAGDELPARTPGPRPPGTGPGARGATGALAVPDPSRAGPRHGRERGDRVDRPARDPRTPTQAAVGAVLEVVVVLSMALLLSLLIKTFLVQAFFIPSASMENTLTEGDRVLVNKLTPGPFDLHRGDVVVFRDPGGWIDEGVAPQPQGAVRDAARSALTFVGLLPQDSGEHLIKRVVGLPGDVVMCCDSTGRLVVNGVPVDETYLKPGSVPSKRTFKVTVPAGALWVMGDNRDVSYDSRFHTSLPTKGFVPLGDVVGQAVVVVWPFDRVGRLSVPGSVFSAVPDEPTP